MALTALAMLLLPALSMRVSNVWHRMAVNYLVLIPLALAGLRVGWRELLRSSVRRVAAGMAAALALYVAGWAAFHGLAGISALSPQVAQVGEWRTAVSPWLSLPLLVLLIVPGEEIVWRGGITLPLAGRLGPWLGCFGGGLLFSAAHLTMGLPLLLVAALAVGVFWSALLLKTRSLVPGYVSHVLWDLAVLFWLPY